MKSKTCSESYHPVRGLLGATLKRQMGISLLITALMFLISPGLLWQEASRGNYSWRNPLLEDFFFWPIAIFLCALLLGIILLCYNHNHFFSRKGADLYYSLPLKRDVLFAVRAGAAFMGAAFAMTVCFIGLAAVNFRPLVYGVGLWDFLKIYGLCLLMLLLCMSTVLLILVNCGRVFHFVFSLFMICGGIPLLFLVVDSWYNNAAFGLTSEAEWINICTPLANALVAIGTQGERIADGVTGNGDDILLVLIVLGQILALTALAFVLNHRRKAERSGSSFVFKAMPVVITAIAAGLGGYLVGWLFMEPIDYNPYSEAHRFFSGVNITHTRGYGVDFWLPFVMGAALTAVAVGAIVSKSFRKIWRWLICAGAVTVILFGLFRVSSELARKDSLYVPAAEDVESVVLSGNSSKPETTIRENVELVTQLHSLLVEENKKGYFFGYYMQSYFMEGSLVFTYHMKDGEEITRSYYVQTEEGYEILLKLMQTEEYTAAWTDALEFTDNEQLEMTCYDWDDTPSNNAFNLSPEEAQELMRTYGRELQGATGKEFWGYVFTLGKDYYNVRLHTADHLVLRVPDDFTETLALVEKYLNQQ